MATSYKVAIALSTPAPPRPLRVIVNQRRLFGEGTRNWCHFTVPPRPRTRTPIQLGAPASYVVAYASGGRRSADVPGEGPAGVGRVAHSTVQTGTSLGGHSAPCGGAGRMPSPLPPP